LSAVRCAVQSSSPIAVLRVSGDLDEASTVTLRSVLRKLLAEQPSGIVIDLAGLTVSDDRSLTVFSAFAGTAADWSCCPVALCAPSPAMATALDRTAVSRAVAVHPTLALAQAAMADTPPVRYRRPLPAGTSPAARARELVVSACAAWRLPDLVDDAEVLVTELVANAVRHAGGGLRLSIALGQRFLHLSLWDGSPVPPVVVPPDPDTGRGGRGLALVDALADSWGSAPRPGGKVVWATLDRTGPVGAPDAVTARRV
jgi:anti-anti-sigma factor